MIFFLWKETIFNNLYLSLTVDKEDVIDDVNALLKLGVGDAYRLEHIKQAFIQNKTIWSTDGNYLQRMREKYLAKIVPDSIENTDENITDSENKDIIHCWKCGKKSSLGANFCMICGASLFEVGTISSPEEKTITKQRKSIGLKIPVLVGIPVLILILIGGAYSQGFFDGVFEKNTSDDDINSQLDTNEKPVNPDEINSKCGTGTVYDSKTNSCVLG